VPAQAVGRAEASRAGLPQRRATRRPCAGAQLCPRIGGLNTARVYYAVRAYSMRAYCAMALYYAMAYFAPARPPRVYLAAGMRRARSRSSPHGTGTRRGAVYAGGPGANLLEPGAHAPGPVKICPRAQHSPRIYYATRKRSSGAPGGRNIYRGRRSTVYLAMIIFNHEYI